jgi:hypothetical protein
MPSARYYRANQPEPEYRSVVHGAHSPEKVILETRRRSALFTKSDA